MGPFSPQGHNLNKLGRGPLDDATYPRPCDFRQEDFQSFHLENLIFSLCDLDMQWNGTINKEWHMNSISARFGKTHPVISEMPFEAIVDIHQSQHEPVAQVS